MREPLLNKREVARYLGVTERTVERWQTELGLPFLRMGGVNRYRPAEIDSWADNGTRIPGTEQAPS